VVCWFIYFFFTFDGHGMMSNSFEYSQQQQKALVLDKLILPAVLLLPTEQH